MKDEVKQQLNSLAMLKSFCFTLRKTVFFSISHMEAPFTWKIRLKTKKRMEIMRKIKNIFNTSSFIPHLSSLQNI